MAEDKKDTIGGIPDQEIQRLIIDAEARATEILTGRRHALDALAEALMKEEILETTEWSGLLRFREKQEAVTYLRPVR